MSLPDVDSAADVPDVLPPNPLQWLVSEALRPDADLREGLLLTYNFDPMFFETHALGSLRSAGAAVTVVADAGAYRADPRGVHSAGSEYVLGLASAHGAFHPKVNVLVGANRASFCVGSGNLSYGGWIANDELSTVFTDDETGTPEPFWQLVDFLNSLEFVRISPTASEGIARTVDALRELLSDRQPRTSSHRLVSSATTPIVDQLPTEQVEELALYAPFHDPAAKAVAALAKRLQPSRLIIAVQQGSTVIEPSSLTKVVADYHLNVDVRALEELPYRHGKLVQATLPDGSRWTLSGSPNLSHAALLSNSSQPSGNVEVGVISTSVAAMLPVGDPIDLDVIRPASAPDLLDEDSSDTGFARLLEARFMDDSVVLVLDRQAPGGLVVQVSVYEEDPEVFWTLGEFPANETTASWPAVAPTYTLTPRSRFRLLAASDDERPLGSVVHLIDPIAVIRRVSRSSGWSSPVYTPAALFSDPVVAAQWERQMSELLTNQQTDQRVTHRLPGGATSHGAVTSAGAGFDDVDAWSRYYSFAVDRLGSSMIDLALGALPQITADDSRTITPAPSGRPSWRDMSEEELLELDEDGLDTDQAAAEIVVEVQAKRNEQVRKRYRTWLRRLVDAGSDVPLIDQMSRTALVLVGTTLNLWDSETGQDGWFDLLDDAANQMHVSDPETLPEELRSAVASLVTACLYRLDEGLPDRRAAAEHVRYQATATRLKQLARFATPEGIAARSRQLDSKDHLAVAEYMAAFAEKFHDDDPLTASLRMLEREHPDWTIERQTDTHVTIGGSFSDPSVAAAETLDAMTRRLPPGTPHAVTASGRRDGLRLVRLGDVLSETRRSRDRTQYTTFDLQGGNAIGVRSGQDRRARVRIAPPRSQPTPEALAVCEAAGVDVELAT